MSRIAPAPFDNPHDTVVDVVLVSVDNVRFYVAKAVLILASSYFRTLFTLPQPTGIGAETDSDTNLPKILMPGEDHSTLETLLRFCYPCVPPSPLNTFDDVHKALRAAIKYDMDKVIFVLKQNLQTLGAQDPPRMFAIACQLRLENEAKAAADMWRAERNHSYHELVSTSYRKRWTRFLREHSAGFSYT